MLFDIKKFQRKCPHVIDLVESFTRKKGFAFLLKSLKFRPYKPVYAKWAMDFRLYNEWIDDYGNIISVKKKGSIYVYHNELHIDEKLITNSDLYSCLTLDKAIRISKVISIIHGTDQDFHKDLIIINCLGLDNYFRSFIQYNGEIYSIPTIFVDVRLLLKIINNLDISYMKDIAMSKLKHFNNPKCFIFRWPANKDVLLRIKGINEGLVEYFLKTIS